MRVYHKQGKREVTYNGGLADGGGGGGNISVAKSSSIKLFVRWIILSSGEIFEIEVKYASPPLTPEIMLLLFLKLKHVFLKYLFVHHEKKFFRISSGVDFRMKFVRNCKDIVEAKTEGMES